MGRPKALVELAGRPLVSRALEVLRDGGCAPLLVVLGAAAGEVAALLPADVRAVTAEDWADGMGASLRAGLGALDGLPGVTSALVHLVDLPGVGAAAVARMVAAGYTGSAADGPAASGSVASGSVLPGSAALGPDVLARAAYDGRPGHPVLLGRSHWPGVLAAARGDAGARDYLAGHPALRLVECGDLADPRDVDTPEALREFLRS
jgi:nicotine blue oxidoreductase